MKKAAVSSRKVPSKAAIQRAVASSTAIETRQPVQVIESQLSTRSGKFRNLKLAS